MFRYIVQAEAATELEACTLAQALANAGLANVTVLTVIPEDTLDTLASEAEAFLKGEVA